VLDPNFAAQEPPVIAPQLLPPEQLPEQDSSTTAAVVPFEQPHTESPHVLSPEQSHSAPHVSHPHPIKGTVLVNKSVPAILSVSAKTPIPATRARPKTIKYFFIVIIF
jgi:hypothetical protein